MSTGVKRGLRQTVHTESTPKKLGFCLVGEVP
jgi:hypothetical protein